MALVAIAIFAIIAMAGLSIDIGTLYQASAEAQRSADSAALAAARMIAMSGLTTDPTNASGSWSQICGGAASPASLAAIATAEQNSVAGSSNLTVTVNYSSPGGSGSKDCSAAGTGFGINPLVTVTVQQSNLPVYFSRIWGASGSSVTVTATAEAFNSSNSGSYATWPRCVKPWVVPNYNPYYAKKGPWGGGGICNGGWNCNCTTDCPAWISAGAIVNPGVLSSNSGVIGETFTLTPDCSNFPFFHGWGCVLLGQPQANTGAFNPSLQYVPGEVSSSFAASTAIPACTATPLADTYAQAIAGCDQSTQYKCGVTNANNVDLSENPLSSGDTTNGGQCLIHQAAGTASVNNGQDGLATSAGPVFVPNYPFQIQAGTSNPLVNAGLASGSTITSSTSIVTVPVYDQTTSTLNSGGQTQVTIIGFLQAFINYVDGNGNVNVTVMNVVGCGSNPGTTFTGTSPVPVRLVSQ